MSTYYNAVPKVVFNGIRDRSRRAFIRPEITFAQHTPLLRLFTETGPTETTFVGDSDDGFAGIFGQQSLDPRSKYFNQQSLLALNLLGQGNGFYVKRLKPEDAGNPARIIVALEMVRDMIPASVTRLSGFNYPDAVSDTGNGPVASATDTVEGYRARVVLIRDNQSEVGTQRVLPGTMISGIDQSQSTVYPLFELPAAFFGAPGNALGARIWCPTALDPDGYDEFTGPRFGTRLFRMQFVELMDGTSTPIIVKTKNDEDYVNISFDEGVFSSQYDRDLTVDDILIDQYDDDGIESGLSPLYSPFSQCFVYRDNVNIVREIIYEAETRVNPGIVATAQVPGQIDFLTMLAEDGDPYQSIKLEGPIEGGTLLGKNATIYASGGNDGTTTLAEYVKQVDIENVNFGQLGDQYENVALYQFGCLYDTGLPMDSKYKAMNVLSKRRDLQYFFTTFVEGEARLPTTGEEVSRVQALMTRLRAFPESTLYGTPVCRAMIVMQSGKLVGGGYNKFVPQLLDVAMMWARYAGAGTGVLRPGFEMDVDPNNRVTMVKNLNVPFFNARTSANLWANGATYSTSYDHRSNYYPCLRSVYLDDTSVLLSPITVNICCVIMRLIHKVHAKFSGNAFLTKEQLIERCDQEILDRTRDLFGGRVDVIPLTEITGIDENNGTSWTCTVTVAANNPRTTLDFRLETVRRENVVEDQ